MAVQQKESRNSYVADDFVDLWSLLTGILSHRRWVYPGLAFGALLGVAAAFLLPKWYEATVVLSPVTDDKASSSMLSSVSGLAAMAGISLSSSTDSRAEAIASLSSNAITEELIKKRKLLPTLFSDDWDPKTKRWTVDDPDDVPNMGMALELFGEEIRFVEEQPNGLVLLTIQWRNAEAARDWAADLVALTNRNTRERAVADAELSMRYLNSQLESTSSIEQRQALYESLSAQINKAMLAKSREDYAFRIIDPPRVANADQFVRPNRILTVVAGIALGIFFAFALGLYRYLRYGVAGTQHRG